MNKAAPPPSAQRPGRAVLRGLLDLRPSLRLEPTALAGHDDAVTPGLAAAKVYAFASVDYPGAAQSQVFDSDGTTAVAAFAVDPDSGSSRATAFTFTDGVYRILPVPSSTDSTATGITGGGLIVGTYEDLNGVRRGFANDGGAFSNVDFPGAAATQAFGVNDAGQIVGSYFDAARCSGAFAEYARAPEDQLVKKPANLTFEQAAASACPPAPRCSSFATTRRCSPGRKS